ncbi:MAG TPA: hypothetical protein P5121_35490 [Caldilineaceae bacterium]|nr:hypothetical protein [Caldilineaceae bacterium]
MSDEKTVIPVSHSVTPISHFARIGGIGGRECEDDNLDEAMAAVKFVSFTVTPEQVRPGAAVVLSWNVQKVGGRVRLLLNGSPVDAQGTRTVHPFATTTYQLAASGTSICPGHPHLTQYLGSRTVSVHAEDCVSSTIAEEGLRNEVQNKVKELVDQSNGKIHFRHDYASDVDIQVEEDGLHIRMALKLNVPDFWDPDLNVDASIVLSAVDGRAVAAYVKFGTEVHWPWYVHVITSAVTLLIQEILDHVVDGIIKPELLKRIQDSLDERVQQIPPRYLLSRLTTMTNYISVTVCPV